MLNIRITYIKVAAISNLGSLNIGKALFYRNRATSNAYEGPGGNADASAEPPDFVQPPTPPAPSVPTPPDPPDPPDPTAAG